MEMKVLIQCVMLWKFQNNKISTETLRKICSILGLSIITDYQVWNWFSKFYSGDTLFRDGRWSDFNQDAIKESVGWNPCKSIQELALDHDISQSTICHHLKSKQTGHLASSYT